MNQKQVDGSNMGEAFVLIRVQQVNGNSDLDYMQIVKDEIAKLKGVRNIKGVFGLYDFVATVETETAEELGILVTHTIRNVKGVAQTETMVVGF
jgi:DNA-binding Lrp family transcriptional regulator